MSWGTVYTLLRRLTPLPPPEELRATWVSLEQIVEAALFLVSPAGEGVNGVVLPVQGEGI